MRTPQARADETGRGSGSGPLAIIAGNGSLPVAVAEAAANAGREVHVIGIRGEADPALEKFPHVWVKWGEVGRLFSALEDRNCRDLVIIGGVKRPDFANIRFDLGAIRDVPRLVRLISVGGDDGILSAVVRFFEEKGYRVYGADDVAPELVAGEGTLGAKAPSAENLADIKKGFEIVNALGRFDIGQAVVVAKGLVLAIEALEGTDAILARCAALRGDRHRHDGSGVLVKAPKPGQDERVDLPTIGPETARRAAEARLAGIAVAAGQVLMAHPNETIAAADANGLFLYGQRLTREDAV